MFMPIFTTFNYNNTTKCCPIAASAEHAFVVMGNIDFHVLYNNASNFLYLSAYKGEGDNRNELEVLNLNQLFNILLMSWVKLEYSIYFACILLHSEFQL
jgi:hypothetical protein